MITKHAWREKVSNQHLILLGLKKYIEVWMQKIQGNIYQANKWINQKVSKRVYQFSDGDLNKFVLLLPKDIYPYEYMDSWERFNETSLPPKKSFYTELNLEDISDKDYLHAQKVWDVFEIRNLGEYHDLYVQTDTSLLADVFEKFRDTCIEIYRLDSSHFLSAPGLAWQACLKKQM